MLREVEFRGDTVDSINVLLQGYLPCVGADLFFPSMAVLHTCPTHNTTLNYKVHCTS